MVYDTIFAEFLYNTSVYKVSHELLQTADSKDRQDTSGDGKGEGKDMQQKSLVGITWTLWL